MTAFLFMWPKNGVDNRLFLSYFVWVLLVKERNYIYLKKSLAVYYSNAFLTWQRSGLIFIRVKKRTQVYKFQILKCRERKERAADQRSDQLRSEVGTRPSIRWFSDHSLFVYSTLNLVLIALERTVNSKIENLSKALEIYIFKVLYKICIFFRHIKK